MNRQPGHALRGGAFRRCSLFTSLAFGALLVGLGGAACGGEAWSRWRGAEGAGHGGDARFPAQWSPNELAWSVDLPGEGNASPVVWRSHVYVASAVLGMRIVTCHDLATGNLIWRRDLPGPIEAHHAQNSAASGSVAVDDRGVYWMWGTSEGARFEALDHDGHPRWQVDLGPFRAEHGFAATPAVCGDLLIVPNDQDSSSCVLGLEAATGRERWRLDREPAKADYSTPLVVDRSGRTPLVILTSMAHGITGIDVATGNVVWETRCLPKRAVSSPILAGDLVIGTSGDGGGDNKLAAVRLPKGHEEPTVVYTLNRGTAPYVPTPLHVDGLVYLWGDRGVVTCIRADSGETVWKNRVGGNYYASPIAVGGTIRNVSLEGEAVTIRAGETFEVLGRADLGETCRATPAVVGSRMVFRTVGRLMAIDAVP